MPPSVCGDGEDLTAARQLAHKAVAVEDIDLRAADVIGDGAPARRKHGRVRELHLRVVANGPVLTEDADLPSEAIIRLPSSDVNTALFSTA